MKRGHQQGQFTVLPAAQMKGDPAAIHRRPRHLPVIESVIGPPLVAQGPRPEQHLRRDRFPIGEAGIRVQREGNAAPRRVHVDGLRHQTVEREGLVLRTLGQCLEHQCQFSAACPLKMKGSGCRRFPASLPAAACRPGCGRIDVAEMAEALRYFGWSCMEIRRAGSASDGRPGKGSEQKCQESQSAKVLPSSPSAALMRTFSCPGSRRVTCCGR